MEVLVAPDSFGGSLTAGEAAAAIAGGWRRARPGDAVSQAPQSDGGPGFVEVLESAAGAAGVSVPLSVPGPAGETVVARLLRVAGPAGGTVYIESAQACGLHLLPGGPSPESALAATSHGVGVLVRAAVEAGAGRIVVGLGGSACTDGGRGAAEAFGGPARMRRALSGLDVVAATDVLSPTLGPLGSAAVFGPQKGADVRCVALLEERLCRWCTLLRAETGFDAASVEGGGAAGGLGALLLAVGGRVVPGAAVIGAATDRADAIGRADVVVTGEGRFDVQSCRGKVVARIAAEAGAHGTAVVVVAGSVDLTEPVWRRLGVDAVADVSVEAGGKSESLARPAAWLERAAGRVAGDPPRRAQSM